MESCYRSAVRVKLSSERRLDWWGEAPERLQRFAGSASYETPECFGPESAPSRG